MLRKLLNRVGVVNTTIFLSIVATAISLSIYIIGSLILGRILVAGLVFSSLIPALLAPPSMYLLFGTVKRLDEAESELRQVNDQLEEANKGLAAEIKERVAVEQQVKASLEEKKVLLKEIHHRVKNNLQIIASLLSLQTEQLTDPSVSELLDDSQHRVRSMALIHEKLYGSDNLAKVDFNAYVQDLTSYLVRSYRLNTVDVAIDVTDIFLGIDLAVPCGLILNELVSNSLKHAFTDRQKGTISVKFSENADARLTLVVEDDGIGFPPELKFQQATSLGLQLVAMLADQLDAEVDMQSGTGTRIKIEFQLPKD